MSRYVLDDQLKREEFEASNSGERLEKEELLRLCDSWR